MPHVWYEWKDNMKNLLFIPLAIAIFGLVGLTSCRITPSQPVHDVGLYATQTVLPTQTPIVVQITTTALATQTPDVVVVSATPNYTKLCVNAVVAVYLRPSPSVDNYPIRELPNGSELVDLGGRDGKWLFVQFGDKVGWVYSDYLGGCE